MGGGRLGRGRARRRGTPATPLLHAHCRRGDSRSASPSGGAGAHDAAVLADPDVAGHVAMLKAFGVAFVSALGAGLAAMVFVELRGAAGWISRRLVKLAVRLLP